MTSKSGLDPVAQKRRSRYRLLVTAGLSFCFMWWSSAISLAGTADLTPTLFIPWTPWPTCALEGSELEDAFDFPPLYRVQRSTALPLLLSASAGCLIFATNVGFTTIVTGVCILASCFHSEEVRHADTLTRSSRAKKQHGRVREKKDCSTLG